MEAPTQREILGHSGVCVSKESLACGSFVTSQHMLQKWEGIDVMLEWTAELKGDGNGAPEKQSTGAALQALPSRSF